MSHPLVGSRAGRLLAGLAAVLVLAPFLGTTFVLARENSRRDARLQPERVMDAVGVRPGMVIGEAGAGRGYFTFKLARRVGESGTVYANDIDKDVLDEVEDRCRTEGIQNIHTILGEVEDPLFPVGALDMAFLVYALHDFDEPVAFLENLERYLKPGATVVVLDQDPDVTGEHDHFLTGERVRELFRQGGYELAGEETFLERDMVIVFRAAS